MEKIIYAITKIGKKENEKMSGIGYATDTDIIIACNSKANKPYVRVFENAIENCHQMQDKQEWKGSYEEIRTVELEDETGKKTSREVITDYLIWYKKAD